MWIKNILKAFSRSTEVEFYCDGVFREDIKTVADFLNNGLLTYSECNEGDLIIENNKIVINW